MLMMTHTWILKEFLGSDFRDHLDLYIYNICPDLLPIHRDITSEITHGIPRIYSYPPEHQKAAFVLFHLLVDDMAHHGRINAEPVRGFNPDSQGYAYIRGQTLIGPIIDFYHRIGMEIDYRKAAYRAHMIIEMTFDLQMIQEIGQQKLFELFCEAVDHTANEKMDELCTTLDWLFRIETATIRQALEKGLSSRTLDRMKSLLNIEGRIGFYIDRFGLDRGDDPTWEGTRMLLLQGMRLVSDYDAFLHPTLNAIKISGFPCSLQSLLDKA